MLTNHWTDHWKDKDWRCLFAQGQPSNICFCDKLKELYCRGIGVNMTWKITFSNPHFIDEETKVSSCEAFCPRLLWSLHSYEFMKLENRTSLSPTWCSYHTFSPLLVSTFLVQWMVPSVGPACWERAPWRKRALLPVFKSTSLHWFDFTEEAKSQTKVPIPFPPPSYRRNRFANFPQILSFTLFFSFFTVRVLLAESFPAACAPRYCSWTRPPLPFLCARPLQVSACWLQGPGVTWSPHVLLLLDPCFGCPSFI